MKRCLPFLFLLLGGHAIAQDSAALKQHIEVLCSRSFSGRGYVGKGMQKAARYIEEQYKAAGLLAFSSNYKQAFSYSVNTFPSTMDVKISGRTLQAGKDYLVHPGSSGAQVEQLKLRTVDFAALLAKAAGKKKATTVDWGVLQKKIAKKKYAYYLTGVDSLKSALKWTKDREVVAHLPEGVFLWPKKVKPIWPVSREVYPATVIELYDSSIVRQKKDKVDVAIDQKYLKKFDAENVIAYVPGTEYTDSFIVVTAHYDHLGKMGNKALFPGASDNASGTAMLLELAKFYAAHPARFTMVFIAFAGEEAGLMGSAYFVEHPSMPLSSIRFLLNLDILGDASMGLSVVNGEAHRDEFQMLAALNKSPGEDHFVFPEIRMGGPAANSDHYHFSQKGVPAFFIFSMGGKGYYHDIWDKAENVSLKNIPEAGQLIKRFIATF